MSFFGLGAASGITTIGAIVTAGVGGAVVAGAFAVASTQVAANVTQPSQKDANVSNVNAPSYAE
jgi:hypothetical protein